MGKDEDKNYIPDAEEKKHYTLAEAYELLKDKEDVYGSDTPVSEVQNC